MKNAYKKPLTDNKIHRVAGKLLGIPMNRVDMYSWKASRNPETGIWHIVSIVATEYSKDEYRELIPQLEK